MPFDSTLDVDADAWLCTLSLNGRRPATLKSYENCASRLARFVDHPLRDVSRPEAMAFVSQMRERYKPGGVALYVRTLRGFYNWCVEEGIVHTNPFARLKVAIPKEIKPTPSNAEVDAMLRKAVRHRRDYAMLALLADTGCRKGEIAALKVDNIDLTSGVVHFPVSKTIPRVVPLTDRAHRALTTYLRTRPSERGGLWCSEDPYSLVVAVTKRYSPYTPHALRRAFAVRWLANGGSEVGLMRIAGWSSREMIAVYTAARAEELAHVEMRRVLGA